MKAAKSLVVGALVCLSAGYAVAESATAPQIVATAWTPAQSAAPAMPQVGSLVPGGSPSRATPGQHATTQVADESHSNGRLMLIGGLLIGVIALRSRKNSG